MKLLFLVNDFGNGNVMRCKPLISELQSRHKVCVFSSKEKLDFLEGDIKKYIKKYQYKNFYSIKNLCFYLYNCFQLGILLVKIKPDRIILDSDYHIFPYAVFLRKKIFSINNSFYVVRNFVRGMWKFSFIMEFLDYCFQNMICSKVIVPLIVKERIPDSRGKFIFFPLWSSIGPSAKKNNNILVIEGGSDLQGSPDFYQRLYKKNKLVSRKVVIVGLKHIEKEHRNGIELKGFINNIQNEIDQAELLIIRGGMSSISDAFGSCLPTIVIPLRNHFEQSINSISASKELGFYYSEDFEKLPDLINTVFAQNKKWKIQNNHCKENITRVCNFIES